MPLNNYKKITALIASGLIAVSLLSAVPADKSKKPAKPNILIILTDDQGLSDLGFYGNPSLETPYLDALAAEGVRLEDFSASPTCSPTRAAMLTGKHEFKVGVTHTISGRSLLRPGVITLPEHLQNAGYRTGIFGKWHLGETYPSRPQDRGFDEVFTHLGGGIGQTPDYWGNTYFDPQILHNGEWVATEGYCTKVFSDAAWDWIESGGQKPWLAYVAYNAPHTPLQIDDAMAQKYLDKGLPESQARFYAMIEDLDREVGILLQKLEANGLAENTLVIFMGDNGSAKGGKPAEMEFNAGLRGTKASAFQGGVRVPCLIRWPAGGLVGGISINQMTSMIDLFPTFNELAGIAQPVDADFDGRSIAPLLKDPSMDWPNRTLVTHVGRWANGKAEKHKYKGSSIRNERFSLIEGETLYDLQNDRAEAKDVSKQYPEVFDSLKEQYETWWSAVLPIATDVPPLFVGAAAAPVSHLNCMDWGASMIEDQGPKYPPWNQGYVNTIATGQPLPNIAHMGAWKLEFARSGQYRITLRTLPEEAPYAEAKLEAGTATLIVRGEKFTQAIPAGARAITFDLAIDAGVTELETLIEADDASPAAHGAFYVSIEYLNP